MAKNKSRIKWRTGQSPADLANDFLNYGDRVMKAIKAVADYIAAQAMADMKNNARWTDRTGNARSGLFSVAEETAKDIVTIFLSHGTDIDYGLSLEVRYGGKYAVIMPTIRRIIPQLKRMLVSVFKV